MPPRPNVRVLRDIKARKGVAENEISRRAYLYVARNQTLPAQVRYQAQLQLNNFGRYTRPTTVKNRCIASGRGRGIISEFGLCRVRWRISHSPLKMSTLMVIYAVPVSVEGTRW
jgi:small subunit ribosomal protein S14